MRYVLSAVMTIGMVAAVFFGQGWIQKQSEKQAREAAEAAAAAQDPANDPTLTGDEREDVRLSQKLQPYIGAFNSNSRYAHSAMQSYLKRAGAEKGPEMKKGKVDIWLNPTHDPARHVKAMAEIEAREPAMPELQSAGKRYGKALAALHILTGEASSYYKEKDYEDDGLAKGKALHSKLVAAYKEFAIADSALGALIEKENDALKVRRLAFLEKRYGRSLRFLTANLLYRARMLVGIASVDSPSELPLETFQAQLGAYQKARTELTAYIAAHPDEAGKVTLLSSLVSAGADFGKSAKQLMRRRRDNKPWSKSDKWSIDRGSAERVDGHPAQVVHEYNELIDDSNRLSFRS